MARRGRRPIRDALDVRTVLRTSPMEYADRIECLLGLESRSEEREDLSEARLAGSGGETSFTCGESLVLEWECG